jgi:hypothetical protein
MTWTMHYQRATRVYEGVEVYVKNYIQLNPFINTCCCRQSLHKYNHIKLFDEAAAQGHCT